jgi:hypothetical protein
VGIAAIFSQYKGARMLIVMIVVLALMLGSGHEHIGMMGHEMPNQQADHGQEGNRVKIASNPAIEESGGEPEHSVPKK